MASFHEKIWFRVAAVSASLMILLGVLGIFFGREFLKERAQEKKVIAIKKAKDEYDERYRQGMLKMRQNLKLDHFLAAYKNFQITPQPPSNDPFALQDYLDVVRRIGNGLIANQLLHEAEEVFALVRDYEISKDGKADISNASINQINSRRFLESAHNYLSQIDKLMEHSRYQDALGDLKKCEQELHAVEALAVDDVSAEWEKWRTDNRIIKYRVYADEADKLIKEAIQKYKLKDYKAVDSAMSRAANATGKAAFFNQDAPEIAELRQRLVDLDAEIAVSMPNSLPVTNHFKRDMIGKLANYFYLNGYEFDISKMKEENAIHIGLQYFLRAPDTFYIVRYRIFYYNNRDSFNGEFLTEKTGTTTPVEGLDDPLRSVEFRQPIPDKLRGVPIRRIEIKVFSSDDQLVSQVTRAFRKQDSLI